MARLGIRPGSPRARKLEAALLALFTDLTGRWVALAGGPGKKRPVRKIVCRLIRRRNKKNYAECLYRCNNGRWITTLRGKDKPCAKEIRYNEPVK